MKYSRSRDATLKLRVLASAERRASKRTEDDTSLTPLTERSRTHPASPEKLRQLHAARTLSRESVIQPHIVLGTPISSTQQSSRCFRALAPSPPVQPTAHAVASHSNPATIRRSATSLDYSYYLAARFHRAGKNSHDDPPKAGARAKQAAIQRDHRSRRRAGENVSQTPTMSQLGVYQGSEVASESIYPCAVICDAVYELTREHRCQSVARSTTRG